MNFPENISIYPGRKKGRGEIGVRDIELHARMKI